MLGWLSQEEQTAQAEEAPYSPAAVVRVILNHNAVVPGRRYTVRQMDRTTVLMPDRRRRREPLIHLGPEGLHWVGRRARAVGFIPKAASPVGTQQGYTGRALVLDLKSGEKTGSKSAATGREADGR